MNRSLALEPTADSLLWAGRAHCALGYHDQALPLLRAVGNRAGEATTLNNIGGAHQNRGDLETALGYHDQALPLLRAVGDRAGEGLPMMPP